ncbi:MAG: ATP-binding protein [Candidatus Binatia bacterium]
MAGDAGGRFLRAPKLYNSPAPAGCSVFLLLSVRFGTRFAHGSAVPKSVSMATPPLPVDSVALRRQRLVAASVPAFAAVVFGATLLYAIVDLTQNDAWGTTLLIPYLIDLGAPLIAWYLVQGPLQRYPEWVVFGADLAYTVATASQLFQPTSTISGVALILSMKMLATALVFAWNPLFQYASAAVTVVLYFALLAVSAGARVPSLHQILGPLSAAVLSAVGVAVSDRVRRAQWHAEAALRESEERFRIVSQLTSDYAYAFRVTPRGFLVGEWITDAFTRISGFAAGDIRTSDGMDVVHPADRPLVQRRLDDLISGRLHSGALEYRIVTKDNEVRWVRDHSSTVRSETTGRVVRIYGAAQDITEQKRAAATVQEEVALSAAMARVGQELIKCLNTPALLQRLCQLTTEVIGCDSSHTVLWQPDRQAYVAVADHGDPPVDWEPLRAIPVPKADIAEQVAYLERNDLLEMAMVESSDGDRSEDFVLSGHSRAERWRKFVGEHGMTRCMYVALRRGDELIGFQAACFRGQVAPFTPQQVRVGRGIAHLASLAIEHAHLVEEIERANRLKTEFVATMSHELRTPLNIIMGYSDLLEENTFGPLAPAQADTVARIQRSARQLLDLINATLDFTRLERGRVSLELADIRIDELLAEIESEIQLVLEAKPAVHFRWQFEPQRACLRTDRAKLKVILKNLVANAVKFTDTGSVSVVGSADERGATLHIRDTGIGIPPEAQAGIFEAFRQVDSSMTRQYDGVGLGLHIVRRLLDLLGGTISVESEVGRGATFHVCLPCRTDQALTDQDDRQQAPAVA